MIKKIFIKSGKNLDKRGGVCYNRLNGYNRYIEQEETKMRKGNKIAALGFALSMIMCSSFAFASCGGTGGDPNARIDEFYNSKTGEITIPADQNVSIEFWLQFSNASEKIYTPIINQFMKENPNIRVKLVSANADSYLTNLDNQMLNYVPDMFYVPDTDFLRFVSNDVLWDYTDYVTKDELDQIWQAGYERYTYDPAKKIPAGLDDGGRLYGLPKDIGPYAFCVNLDRFEEVFEASPSKNGMTLEEAEAKYLDDKNPMSWDDLLTIGGILRDGIDAMNEGVADSAKKNYWVLSGYEEHSALNSNDASFVTEDGSASRVAEPQFAATFDFMHDLQMGDKALMAGHNAKSGSSKGYTAFKAGNAIFSWIGAWDCASLWGATTASSYFQYKVKALPAPYGPGADGEFGTADDGKSVAYLGGIGYCISARDTTPPIKKAAALKLAKYICYDEDAQRSIMLHGQQVPNLKKMTYDEYLKIETVEDSDGVTHPVNPSNLSVFVDMLEFTDENDKVGGAGRYEAKTLGTEWMTAWDSLVSRQSFYEKDMKAADLVTIYKPTIDNWLTTYNGKIGR